MNDNNKAVVVLYNVCGLTFVCDSERKRTIGKRVGGRYTTKRGTGRLLLCCALAGARYLQAHDRAGRHSHGTRAAPVGAAGARRSRWNEARRHTLGTRRPAGQGVDITHVLGVCHNERKGGKSQILAARLQLCSGDTEEVLE